MKTKIFVFVAAMIIVTSAFADQRFVLGELFTNTGCGPCYSDNMVLDAIRIPYWTKMALIRYHTWWPSSSDPFFIRNRTEDSLRTLYYGVTGVPDLFWDGTLNSSGETNFENEINTRRSVSSPMTMTLTHTGLYTRGTANLTINVSTGVSGDTRLFWVLTEDDVYYNAPNGQRVFYEAMRKMWPNSSGQSVNLSSPGTYNFSQTIDFTYADNPQNCNLVAFVQNYSTKSVHQAVRIPIAQYRFLTYPEIQSGGSGSASATEVFKYALINASNPDNINVQLDLSDVPSGWTVSGNSRIAGDFTGSISISLGTNQIDTLSIVIITNGICDVGTPRLLVSSPNIPGRVDTLTAKFATCANVLLVDDDRGAQLERYYINSLDRLGVNYVYINTPPNAATMSQYDAVIWFTGNDYSSTFTSTDQNNLISYLNGGGRLFATGQDIEGYSSSDITGTTFYQNYLKAQFVNDNSGVHTLNGTSGDPIGDGLTISITGGDGANNQNYPSEIQPRTGANAVFSYQGLSTKAGIRYDSGTFKTVYFSFGFEAISTQANRDTVMARVLRWLDVPMDVVANSPTKPAGISITARPNPFNEVCEIEVYTPENGELYITDLTGKTVMNMRLSRGNHTIRFDGKNLATGMYFIVVRSAEMTKSSRVLLVK